MTIREWTDALLTTIAGKLPPPSVVAVPKWVRPEIERELLTDRKVVLVIVGAGESSPSAQWLPSERHGVLWIDPTRVAQFRASPLTLFGRDCIVAFEVTGDAETVGRAVRSEPPAKSILDLKFVNSRTTYVYLGSEKLPTNVTPKLPYVENPTGVDDAIAKARALGAGRGL